MRSAARLLSILFAFGIGLQLANASSWTQGKAGRIELLTDCDHNLASQLMQLLCRARAFLPYSRFGTEGRERPLRVIVFHSAGEFQRWAPDARAAAYYMPGTRRDVLVFSEESAQQGPIVLHEFTHYVVRGAGLRLPPWLKEGLAEYYSTARFHSNEVLFGGIPPTRSASLRRQEGFPLATLLAMTKLSGSIQDASFLNSFYAQSAALTGLLMEPAYVTKLPAFLAAVSATGDSAGSFASIYHRSIKQVEEDLTIYLRRDCDGEVGLQREFLVPTAIAAQLRAASDLQRDLALAELGVDQKWTRSAVPEFLDRLAATYPGKWQIERLWGDLEWQQQRNSESRQHYSQAAAFGAADAKTLFRLSQLEQEAGAPADRIRELLKKLCA